MKRDALLWIVIVLLACNLAVAMASCSRPVVPKKIEYKIAQAGPNVGPKEIEEILNQLGQDGWLLVHALPGLGFILRR
jgi:flagellar basal body-associated protein FliL